MCSSVREGERESYGIFYFNSFLNSSVVFVDVNISIRCEAIRRIKISLIHIEFTLRLGIFRFSYVRYKTIGVVEPDGYGREIADDGKTNW